jgi:3-phosphoshikimate 1-carboxyvinyltransferase
MREEGGEPVADLRAIRRVWSGCEVPPARAASMIDEYGDLSVVAAFAKANRHAQRQGIARQGK